MESPNLRRRFNLGLALGLVGLFVLALFVLAPLEGLKLNPVILMVQERTEATLLQLGPFFFVAVLGAGVGLAELASTFSDYPRESIATRWGQYLIWLNGAAAMLAFGMARIYAPKDIDPLILVLTVGVGFPTLIRTKFTLAKQFSGQGDEELSVNLGWLYDQFQYLCKKQIDLELMTYRRSKVDRLLERYPTLQELYDTALYTLRARATLSKEEEEAKLAELEETFKAKVPGEVTRLNIGLMILEWGGVAFVDSLTQAPRMAGALPATFGGGAETNVEAVVKRLSSLSLTDLTDKALANMQAPEDQAKVRGLAEPASGLPELTQKASIARYMVDRLGVEAAQRLAGG
jgi:hypothetical protein